jgi:sulfite reductase alpha subunit-like flavoprotein
MYTLAGWSENEIHLLVSLFVKDGKLGLTSKFLASRPKEVRIHAIGSSFNLPKETKTPIVMIANGSGMAPFRSIMHYYKHLAQLK